MSRRKRRRLTVAMHEAWISNDRPTDRNRVLEILESIEFSTDNQRANHLEANTTQHDRSHEITS